MGEKWSAVFVVNSVASAWHDRPTERQTDRETDRETDRQTSVERFIVVVLA
jgi:hypothetical protein